MTDICEDCGEQFPTSGLRYMALVGDAPEPKHTAREHVLGHARLCTGCRRARRDAATARARAVNAPSER